jgi:hypothetical protein
MCASRANRHRFLSDIGADPSKDAAKIDIKSEQLMRHGHGDAVIVLNVGGKEFSTLRSTVAANVVLTERVARAEGNHEFTHGGKAIFIDRDPTHFPLILNHLPNKVEGLNYMEGHACSPSAQFHRDQEYFVQLPKELTALRDLYVEASHYQEEGLQKQLKKKNAIITILGTFSNQTNPFDQATKVFQGIRRGLVAVGGLGTLAVGSQQDLSKAKAVLLPAWFDKEEKDEAKTGEANQVAGA